MLLRHAFRFLLITILPALSQGEPEVYRLKANDEISLSVFGESDLSSTVQLPVSGEVSLPLVGTIKLAGMTLREAEAAVTKLYEGDYLIKPKISINLLDAAAERVIVMGAVNSPGPVGIPANTTMDLVSLIASAGGLAPSADGGRVELKRGDSTKTYDMELLRREGATPVMLTHGDKINVPTNPFANKTITILGDVTGPGTFNFPTTGHLDVATLVGLAGGLTKEADQSRITVKRGTKTYAASMRGATSRLQPGDIVTIPKNRFVGQFVTMMGQVGKAGPLAFPLDGKLDVLTAISTAGGFERLANKKKVVVTRRVGGARQSWTLNVEDMAEGKAPLFQLLPGDAVSVPVRRF